MAQSIAENNSDAIYIYYDANITVQHNRDWSLDGLWARGARGRLPWVERPVVRVNEEDLHLAAAVARRVERRRSSRVAEAGGGEEGAELSELVRSSLVTRASL